VLQARFECTTETGKPCVDAAGEVQIMDCKLVEELLEGATFVSKCWTERGSHPHNDAKHAPLDRQLASTRNRRSFFVCDFQKSGTLFKNLIDSQPWSISNPPSVRCCSPSRKISLDQSATLASRCSEPSATRLSSTMSNSATLHASSWPSPRVSVSALSAHLLSSRFLSSSSS